MRERLKVFGYLALFWIVFQIVVRTIFLIYNQSQTADLSLQEIALVYFHGFKMDLSLCGYLMVLTGLGLCISVFVQNSAFKITFHTLIIVCMLLSAIIVIVDIELYRHWGFRMNTTPLMYMGSEAMGSISVLVVTKLLLIFTALFTASMYVYWKLISRKVNNLAATSKKAFVPLLLLTAAMFFPIRGSLTVAPMNTGFVFFHKTKVFANHSAINVLWNFMNSLRKTANVKYPENFYDQTKAEKYFEELHTYSDSTTRLFNSPRPNVILFILESYTAGVIEPLGGPKGLTPNLNQLCSEGILFDNFYASGDRTDKGLISVLSGYPAQPETSIIKFPAKTQRLPYLNHYMKALGYRTSFVYGGDVDFANFRSYLTSCQFDEMTTEDDFPSEVNLSKWGVHDHLVLERAFQESDSAKNPFFKVILTLSSHEPFDVPMKPYIKSVSEESLFLNSCRFTDSTIGDFISKAKQRAWWKNTVVVFVADHGHRHPGNKQAKDKARYHIPFLMVGGAIKSDTVIHTYGSQVDIANTLLAQLDKPAKEFRFSKNLLASEVQSFAQYFYNDGYGFVREDAYLVFENVPKQFMFRNFRDSLDIDRSKAYQQILYSDYNRK